MASLLELTSQGDVGTISDESKLSQVKLMSPPQLYELWEKQNWVSHTIGFETDTAQWQDFDKSADVNEFAFRALTRRLKVIGVSLPTVGAAA